MSTRGGIATFVRTMRTTPLWDDWNITHISTHRNGTVWTRAVTFAAALVRLCVELLCRRPDLVHIHTSSNGSFLRKCTVTWLCKAIRIPVVLHVHGSRFDEFHDRMPAALRWLIRVTLDHADVVVALGETWGQRLRRIAPRARIEVVPNAVEPGDPVDQSDTGEVRVVFLGEIGERKGTFVLLDAWADAVARCRVPALLTIAGDGETDRALTRSRELGVGRHVRITGWLSEDEVSHLLDDSHILVLPSRNEGQPMAILEAMARGLCVVASDVGGIPELIGGAGVTVAPDDAGRLADELLRVLSEPAVRTELGNRALARIRDEFDVAVVSRRFDAIYREITE